MTRRDIEIMTTFCESLPERFKVITMGGFYVFLDTRTEKTYYTGHISTWAKELKQNKDGGYDLYTNFDVIFGGTAKKLARELEEFEAGVTRTSNDILDLAETKKFIKNSYAKENNVSKQEAEEVIKFEHEIVPVEVEQELLDKAESTLVDDVITKECADKEEDYFVEEVSHETNDVEEKDETPIEEVIYAVQSTKKTTRGTNQVKKVENRNGKRKKVSPKTKKK